MSIQPPPPVIVDTDKANYEEKFFDFLKVSEWQRKWLRRYKRES